MIETDWLASRSPRKDLVFGFGGSLGIHLAIVLAVLLSPSLTSKRTIALPSYQVKLVSSADLGPVPGAGAGASHQVARKAKAPVRPKPEAAAPIVPVKRLQSSDKPPSRMSLSKVESSVKVPTLEAKPPDVAKHLDELLPKTTTKPPSPRPVTKQNAPSDEEMKELDALADPGDAAARPRAGKGSGQGSGSSAGAAGAGAGAAAGGKSGPPGPSGPAGSSNGEEVGLAQKLYYTEVWNAIRSRWALPSVLRSSSLEAVIIVVIRRDGRILESRFEKRSGNEAFDDSAMRAVKKADPLPPFPDIFSPRQTEIGVRFRPQDLS